MEPDKITPNTPDQELILAIYWRSNLKPMGILLFVWAFAGLGCSVFLPITSTVSCFCELVDKVREPEGWSPAIDIEEGPEH